jgi:uncharacterized protein (PEP-CTERM system associated)
MFAVRTSFFRRALVGSAIFALIAASGLAHAQTPGGTTFDGGLSAGPITSAGGTASPLVPPSGSSQASPGTTQPQLDYSDTDKASTLERTSLAGGGAVQSFEWGAGVSFSQSYMTNAAGISGVNRPDYRSSLGFSANLHEHTRSLSIDANYNFAADFYANNTVPTQISNNLQAIGTAQIIPEYLNLNLRAFAQPVVTSGVGVLTADNHVVPGTYTNSYGYYVTPDLVFRFGEFASSETFPSFGQVFFSTPTGTTAANTIPGLRGAQDTTMRSVTERITGGPDFGRLNWMATGLFSETDNAGSLLSEKTGVVNLQYAIDYEWSLILTGGYDSIINSIPLTTKISSPFGLAGFGLKLGRDFEFQIEAGERYKEFSITSNLRWAVTPTSQVTGAVNDYVQTPEGQLLNNLGTFSASSNGAITSSQNVFANGTGSALGSSNIQAGGNSPLDQQLARYQTGSLAWVEQLGRNSLAFALNGTRRTYLTSGFIGPQTDISWGGTLTVSRNITPLLNGSLGITYTSDQEFGGEGNTIGAQGNLNYSLSRTTNVYLQSSYLTRDSSPALQVFSPLTGDLTDFVITIGISHAF